MFDIGWDELLLIALVALVVIGPKDLPVVLRTVGRWVARARALAGEFRSHVDDMMREAGVDDMKREFSDMAHPPELKEIEDNLMIGNAPPAEGTPGNGAAAEASAAAEPGALPAAPEAARNDAAAQ